jgi:diaminohydroxyphosphoribosylaminopyrimidine deaminase/5-amino-6-(5-phosphoribosylamino)uracil reductase
VGIGTALADDPELTVRDAIGSDPARVVFDSQLRLPTDSKLARSAHTTRTLVLCTQHAPEARARALAACGVEVVRVPSAVAGPAPAQLELRPALASLAQLQLGAILIEGGAGIAGALLREALADELHAFIAPILLGPEGRACIVGWPGPDAPASAPRLIDPAIEPCDRDVYVHGRLTYPPSDADGTVP